MDGLLFLKEGTFKLSEVLSVLKGERKEKRSDKRILSSRGFDPVEPKGRKTVLKQRKPRNKRARIISRAEILYEEIIRHARNKPMKIIGSILILLESGYGYYEVNDPRFLLEFISEFGFENISRQEMGRVLDKIEDSDLLEKLVLGEQVGLQKAYHLYR